MDRDYKRIVYEYSDMLFKISMHYVKSTDDAQDIVQQVFLKLVESNVSFLSSQHEKAWLIRVCTNQCKDFLKSAYNRKVVSESETPLEPHIEIDGQLEDGYVLDYVRRLPDKQKTAIYLFYYEEMSVNEIAKIMSTKQNTVLSWLSRGRKALKEMLKEDI